MHEGWIAEKNLVWLGEGLIILGLGCEQRKDLGLVEGVKHLEP